MKYLKDMKKIKDPRITKTGKQSCKIIKEFLKDQMSQKSPRKSQILQKYNLNISVGKEFFPIKNFKQKNLKFEFSTSNGRGREVEYYSSFIFSIDIKIKNKQKTFISGGRFNDLTSKFLACENTSSWLRS